MHLHSRRWYKLVEAIISNYLINLLKKLEARQFILKYVKNNKNYYLWIYLFIKAIQSAHNSILGEWMWRVPLKKTGTKNLETDKLLG